MCKINIDDNDFFFFLIYHFLVKKLWVGLHLPPSADKGHKESGSFFSGDLISHLLGSELADLSSWHGLVCLLNRQTNPVLLGNFRFLFGLLMAFGITQQQVLSYMDHKYQWAVDLCKRPFMTHILPLPASPMPTWTVLV
uniref:Uncharacterized protein n=1 Tax=Salvator merianae TaxID=96440 RepID=A0A8D0BVL3_SALMN